MRLVSARDMFCFSMSTFGPHVSMIKSFKNVLPRPVQIQESDPATKQKPLSVLFLLSWNFVRPVILLNEIVVRDEWNSKKKYEMYKTPILI